MGPRVTRRKASNASVWQQRRLAFNGPSRSLDGKRLASLRSLGGPCFNGPSYSRDGKRSIARGRRRAHDVASMRAVGDCTRS